MIIRHAITLKGDSYQASAKIAKKAVGFYKRKGIFDFVRYKSIILLS